jgi:DNA polymerase-3 subunit delta
MAKTKSSAPQALDYLDQPDKYPPGPVCVVYGDDAYLKRESLRTLRRSVLGEDDGAFSLTVLDAKVAELRDIRDELSTRSMFGPSGRMVLVEDADEFVTRNRAALEDYVAAPAAGGVLALEVKSWPGNTKLAKAVAASGWQVECKKPAAARLRKWLIARAKSSHRATLASAAADLLLDLSEPEVGLLDQELGRLALMVGEGGAISPQLVKENVGSWRTRKAWDMVDAAAEGDAREALRQLDRLVAAGESPIALLALVSTTLRRFTRATRIIEQAERDGRRVNLRAALEQAGVQKFVLSKAEGQLKQIGRVRASEILRWLLDADLALKGASSGEHRARIVLEQIIARLSRQAKPAKV